MRSTDKAGEATRPLLGEGRADTVEQRRTARMSERHVRSRKVTLQFRIQPTVLMKSHLALAFLTLSMGTLACAQDRIKAARKQSPSIASILAAWDSYFNANNLVGIPMDRLPANGECLLWFPQKKQSDQPPSVNCSQMTSAAPGAVLVSRERDASVVDVAVYGSRVAAHVIARGTFGVRAGSILRVTSPTSLSRTPP